MTTINMQIPDGINNDTMTLVVRFASALAEKLRAAEVKYGYSNKWMDDDWMDECREKLADHLRKGDPRDVAAYCAFLWHHGEPTYRDTDSHVITKWERIAALEAEVARLREYVRKVAKHPTTGEYFVNTGDAKTGLELARRLKEIIESARAALSPKADNTPVFKLNYLMEFLCYEGVLTSADGHRLARRYDLLVVEKMFFRPLMLTQEGRAEADAAYKKRVGDFIESEMREEWRRLFK